MLETGHERLVSSDEVSQASLDSLQPCLVEPLENNLLASIRARSWITDDFRLRAKVDNGRPDARVRRGRLRDVPDSDGGKSDKRRGNVPACGELGRHARRHFFHEVTVALGDFVFRIAWCWLLRCGR